MSNEPTTTIELDDHRHQRRLRLEWYAERGGIAVVALVLAAALLGLLGPGPLSHRLAVSSDGLLSVEHYAIQRSEAPAQLVVRFRAPDTSQGLVRIGVSRAFTDRITVDSISPEPTFTELHDERLVFNFRVASLSGEGRIIFRYKNDSFGFVDYVVDVADRSGARVSQFVLP